LLKSEFVRSCRSAEERSFPLCHDASFGLESVAMENDLDSEKSKLKEKSAQTMGQRAYAGKTFEKK
jgi:hypothetical protein